MNIRSMAATDQDATLAIADALPEWFNDDGRRNIRVDLQFQHGFVAASGEIDGFILYYVNEGVGHIAWLGVARKLHRQGVGRALVEHLETHLRRRGAAGIQVHTLGDGVDYEPYVATRAFYRALGYSTLRVEQHPENPGCPESLYLHKKF